MKKLLILIFTLASISAYAEIEMELRCGYGEVKYGKKTMTDGNVSVKFSFGKLTNGNHHAYLQTYIEGDHYAVNVFSGSKVKDANEWSYSQGWIESNSALTRFQAGGKNFSFGYEKKDVAITLRACDIEYCYENKRRNCIDDF